MSCKDNENVVFSWMPNENLDNMGISPSFIKEKIHNINNHTEHFITYE